MSIIDRYTFDELQEIAFQCFSNREFARRLGYSPESSDSIKEIIKKYNLDVAHFKGQGWNKDNVNMSMFRYNNAIKSSKLIRALTILRGWKCEKCGRTEWEEKRIPLCVHHIDGNHINNELNNLMVLCPNCHAQTDNYCGKNKSTHKPFTDEEFVEALKNTTSIRQALQSLGINYAAKYYYDKAHYLIDKYNIVQKRKAAQKIKSKTKKKKKTTKEKQKNYCIDCGKEIHHNAKRCIECEHKKQRKIEWPQRDELKEMIRSKSFSAIGRLYNVSDNAIRKWCKNYNLPFKKSEIKKYSDEEWVEI